ncbi:hypothetical protein PFLUV_G00040050 [Perca fluviatilis]|uniref:Uncharacterized protein n=1 Tax=Perca fluviatilis TaxID=8168 RepID=A0A6A5FF08_PERFL|nr:hypothetical protein PFLUV_G00040050 [Perca fluviatilis]
MRSECAHKAEHTLQKHVKESVERLLTLGFLQHTEQEKARKVQFVELDEPEKSRQHSANSVTRTPLTTLNAEIASIAVENGCSDDRIMCR